jgi:hypothetical protein
MENKDLILMWRKKAVSRNAEIKELKKRIKEKERSRDNWKTKYLKQKSESDKLKKEMENIKKKIEKIL